MAAISPIMVGEDIINGCGAWTIYGASRATERVGRAVGHILGRSLEIEKLHDFVGSRIARCLNAEAACVVSCGAAALMVAAAACLTGEDEDAIARLPRRTGIRSRIVVQSGHNCNFGASIGQMVELSGAEVVEAGSETACTTAELHEAIDRRTAAVLVVVSYEVPPGKYVAIRDVASICRSTGTPLIVDCAGQTDPRPFIEDGADLVIWSGQKCLGGVTAGLLIGRADLVRACRLNGKGVARSVKAAKEQLAATLEAVEIRHEEGFEALERQFASRVQAIVNGANRISGLTSAIVQYTPPVQGSLAEIVPDPAVFGVNGIGLARYLAALTPSIRVRSDPTDPHRILISPIALADVDVPAIVAAISRCAGALGKSPERGPSPDAQGHSRQ